MRILQRNLKRTTDTFLFISHTTNVHLFKFLCNIFIGVRIIKEMPGSVASGTHRITICGEVTPICPDICLSVCDLMPWTKFLVGFSLNSVWDLFKKCRRKCDFVKVGWLRIILIKKALTTFYSYFPHFVTHFCQILCRRFPRNATELLWVEGKSMQGEANFPYGCKGNFALIFCVYIRRAAKHPGLTEPDECKYPTL